MLGGAGRRNRALTLCLISDRTRLLAAIGSSDSWVAALLAQVEGAVAGGVDFVQIREAGVESSVLARVVERCVALARGTRTRVLVNDRLDIALATGAGGVHLREDSFDVGAARRLAPAGFLVGRSVHDACAAEGSRSADYLIAGSVFQTRSKPGKPASLGIDGLRHVVRAAGTCPVWAVGGVTADRARELAACGVAGVAAIDAFIPRVPFRAVPAETQKLVEWLRFCFDSTAQLP